MDYQLLGAVLLGVLVLLVCILRFKIPAFIALLLASITTGLVAGLNAVQVMQSIQSGMGGTLGFVATVVGLGAIFGGLLEHTGGAAVIASNLINRAGPKRTSWALMATGFFVAIPVFFDVGFIILFPMIAALQRKTGKSLVYYAVPLLAGLAVTHAFIPPTPGPIAVADLLDADLGWVIFVGFLCGLPAAYVSGILYGKYIGDKIQVSLSDHNESIITQGKVPFSTILLIVLCPIVLILIATLIKNNYIEVPRILSQVIQILGHPFGALILSNLLAWYILGIRINNMSSQKLSKISIQSLQPAGVIILVTGAGGVFKQILTDTKAGEMIAQTIIESGISIIVFAFIVSTLVRVLQGSATVAMITGAGLVAPLLSQYELSSIEVASLVIAIASGATMLSHLNDSGFWLVKEYLQVNEKEGIKIWTVASSILGLTGFATSIIVFWLG